MLKQLLKYEFKATSRTFGVLYLAMLAAAALMGLCLHLAPEPEVDRFPTLGMILIVIYFGGILSLVVVTIVSIIERFSKNLLGAEGYLMNTLPVSTSQLIASKLIVGVVWMLCSVLVGALSLLVMFVGAAPEAVIVIGTGAEPGMPTTGELLNFAAVFLLTIISISIRTVLMIYAACMIGHQFKRHTVLAGIVAFFVMSFAQSWNGGMLRVTEEPVPAPIAIVFRLTPQSCAYSMVQMWQMALVAIAWDLAVGALCFALTNYLMKTRLNIE